MSKCSKFWNKTARWWKVLVSILGLMLCGFHSAAYALEGPDTLQIHGFASQAFIYTSDNNFFGDTQDGSFEFTELGLNASIRPIPDLQISSQILSRRAGEGDDGGVRLDYGLVDYSLFFKETGGLGIRIGRIKNPFGLYNDTRDVAFTRPSIFLPQSIYFDRTRNLALSSDSMIAYGERRIDFGNLFFELGLGYPDVDDIEIESSLLSGDRPGSLDDKISYIGKLLFEQDEGRIRFGISTVILNLEYKPLGSADPFRAGTIRFIPVVLSAQYNAESWSLSSEFARRRIEFEDLVAIPDAQLTGESFYIQAAYQFLNDMEGLVRYDILYQNRDDRRGERLTARGLPNHAGFAKDWTFGLRWDITESLMSRVEYHYVDGTAWLPVLDNIGLSSTKRYWDMFAILLSYRF